MVVLNGRFDGRQVVFDEPVPDGIAVNSPVRVVFDEPQGGAGSLSKIADLARPGGMPADFAEQHEHYLKGTERR